VLLLSSTMTRGLLRASPSFPNMLFPVAVELECKRLPRSLFPPLMMTPPGSLNSLATKEGELSDSDHALEGTGLPLGLSAPLGMSSELPNDALLPFPLLAVLLVAPPPLFSKEPHLPPLLWRGVCGMAPQDVTNLLEELLSW